MFVQARQRRLFFTISEMTGYGFATVCQIVIEVSSAIVKNLWTDSVDCHFPKNEETLI